MLICFVAAFAGVNVNTVSLAADVSIIITLDEVDSIFEPVVNTSSPAHVKERAAVPPAVSSD